MNWAAYISVFFVASSKFLFAPSTGIVVFGLTFWETILVTVIGGISGVTFFYYTAGLLTRYIRKRRLAKEKLLISQGKPVVKKVFTPFRRRIIRIKHSFGLIGIAVVTPCIISIPIGSIIAARFYLHKPQTIFVLYFFVVVWAFVLTWFNDGVMSLLSVFS